MVIATYELRWTGWTRALFVRALFGLVPCFVSLEFDFELVICI